MSPDAVVYVTSRWGEPSQTFVRREAEAVASHEVRVAAASIKEPVPGGNVSSVLHLRPLQVVVGFARSFTRHPGRVLGLVKQIVVLSSPRNIAPQVAAAVIGCAWVGSRRLGRGHLHAHFGWVAATAAWAAAALDDRTFSVALHAFEIHDRRYLDRFTPVPLAAASAVFTESHKDRAIVAERFGVVAEVARLGVPGAWLDPHDDAERSDDLIVSVGRLVEKKGYPVLLRALAITDFPWRLRIVGEGPERQALEALIEELGLGDRVVLSGAATEGEVQAALRSAAVACLASVETPSGDRDGTPMALVESMASGAAVVASDTGSIAELLDDGGVVVPAGDADALAAALDALADRDRRLELGRRGRARVASEWTSDRTAETVLGVLRARGADLAG